MNSQSGFTLIEMLVVLSIIGFTIGMSLVSYNNVIEKQRARQIRENTIDFLKTVKQEANTGAHSCSGAYVFEGQKVEVSTDELKIYSICSADGLTVVDTQNTFQAEFTEFTTTAADTNGDGTGDFSLLSLSRGTDKSSAIELELTYDDTRIHTLEIDISGNIKVKTNP